MKKFISMILCGFLMVGAAGCSSKESAGKYSPGTYSGSAKGFGGDVTVTITVDSQKITDVKIVGDKETEEVGGAAIKKLPDLILSAQSADIDGVSGATFTSSAVKTALKSALNEAEGVSSSQTTSITMKDGVYTSKQTSYAEVNGLATSGNMTLTATVKDNKFTDIAVKDYTDTDIIGGMAYPILADEVTKYQSLNVDSVSGATVSSNAFFSAMSDVASQAGADPEALKQVDVPVADPVSTEYTTDVLVIGAGMAGLTAATEAAENGADVILLEKNLVYSSSTTRSLGYVIGGGTETQKEMGIEDSADDFYNDISALYEGEPELDLDILHTVAENSPMLNTWLTDRGVVFTDVIHKSEKGARATKRIHVTAGGSSVTSALVGAAEKAGVKIMMGTPAVSLIQSDDGSIIGAKATDGSKDDITIHAASTIVTAGSYSNNTELRAELNPRIDNIAYECGSGEGDAYNWFTEVGADIVSIPYTQFMYYSYAAAFPKFPEVIINSPDNPVYDVLLVAGNGKRVTAEDNFCFEFTKENWNLGYDEGYAIVDQNWMDQYPIYCDDVMNTVVPSSNKPFAYKADSIAELAEDVGMDSAALQATVDRYNELCDKGQDDDFGKDAKYMNKLEGPYYIIRLPQITTDGYTGARINTNAQVLGKDGQWIKGLYAAGSCANGQTVSVNYYGCGTSLLTCGVMGIQAAKDAVAHLSK